MDLENNLEILGKLGEGAYGAVHKARIVSTGNHRRQEHQGRRRG